MLAIMWGQQTEWELESEQQNHLMAGWQEGKRERQESLDGPEVLQHQGLETEGAGRARPGV